MIPLIFIEGLPFTSATVSANGITIELPRLLIDTGSAGTVLRRDLLDVFGLQLQPSDQVRQIIGVGGAESVIEKQIDRLSIRDLLIAEPFVAEFGSVNYGLPMDGIIGADFLVQARAVIDFSTLELRLNV